MSKADVLPSTFSKITIEIASPESIIKRSCGEVVNAKTITYKTYKPEPGGLFCERIFGPTKNYKCLCGKFEGYNYYGCICDRCGTAVLDKSVRRERCGHIELATPIANPCFLKQNPSKIGILLGLSNVDLNTIVYCQNYIVINPGSFVSSGIKKMDILSPDKYDEIIDTISDFPQEVKNNEKFLAKTGADGIYDLLRDLDINALYFDLKEKVAKSEGNKQKFYIRKLNVVKNFVSFDGRRCNKPEWMIFKVLPVIPADLRPLVVVDGTVTTVDLNELYKQIIVRNNRLKQLIEKEALEVILRNEKRMLQDAVDALIDKSSMAKKKSNTKVLKSLSELVKGKEGRLRQNLLGKRVDYSGRSVIVINPTLKIYECGIPKNMALEMFHPHIIAKLIDRQIVDNATEGEELLREKNPIVYEILEYILPGYPILLNRAPTLHRMSIQAFQPKLIEGNAIQLNPLVCKQFNADFDGDQMAIHIPLTIQAREEAILLVLSSNNLLKSSDSEPAFIPNMESILGLFYLTNKIQEDTPQDKEIFFSCIDEVIFAFEAKKISTDTKIKIKDENSKNFISTTVGRVIFNSYLPKDFEFINETITSSKIKEIISRISKKYDTKLVVEIIDNLKSLGFKFAYKSGISFKINDLKIPKEKEQILKKAEEEIDSINDNYMMGFISERGKFDQTIASWMKTINVHMMMATMNNLNNDSNKFNTVKMMLSSGARGSSSQILQMCGMRGLMAKSQKISSAESSIIETPITSNFKEGLSVLEYFISTYGGRKGMTDTALKTSEAGYLTRKLVDVAQNVIIKEFDCGTKNKFPVYKFDQFSGVFYDNKKYKQLLVGRVCAEDIIDLSTDKIIAKKNEMITETIADNINKIGITCVYIRSVLTCNCENGVCALCYGKSLGFNTLAQVGEPIGIIAAQSIGEPGTQLTLNTFHIGGVASATAFDRSKTTNFDGIVKIIDLESIEKDGKQIVISNFCEIHILHPVTNLIQEIIQVPYSSILYIKDQQKVKKGDLLFEWDQYFSSIIAPKDGSIEFKDFEDNIVIKETQSNGNNIGEKNVIKIKNNNIAHIILHTKNKEYKYRIYEKCKILVDDKEKIKAGTTIMKSPRNLSIASDITGGLPKATSLFEAKNIDKKAILSDIKGVVRFGSIVRGNMELFVESKFQNIKSKYIIPFDSDILVQDGDIVKCGSYLCKGEISPQEILRTKGFLATCDFLLKGIKSVYQLQGITIQDKHIEIIIQKMFSFVEILDSGDTTFTNGDIINKEVFMEENEKLYKKHIITNPGDSMNYKKSMIISSIDLAYENENLLNKGLKPIEVRKSICAKAKMTLHGISQVALNSNSFLSAASFQFTINVLSNSAIMRKTDDLSGIKENIVIGHKIPAGTGFPSWREIEVTAD